MACSAGGHLAETLSLVEKLGIDPAFFTFKIPEIGKTLKNYDAYFTINPRRNIFKFARVFCNSISFLLRYRPKVIISSGGGFIIPLCIIGRIFGAKLVFIETSSRITEPSIAGRVLYPFSNLFFVQWKPMLKRYGKKAVYGGLLI